VGAARRRIPSSRGRPRLAGANKAAELLSSFSGHESRRGEAAPTAAPRRSRKCLRRRIWPVIIKNRARRPGKFNWEVLRGSEDPICRAQRPALFLRIFQGNATGFCGFLKKNTACGISVHMLPTVLSTFEAPIFLFRVKTGRSVDPRWMSAYSQKRTLAGKRKRRLRRTAASPKISERRRTTRPPAAAASPPPHQERPPRHAPTCVEGFLSPSLEFPRRLSRLIPFTTRNHVSHTLEVVVRSRLRA